MTRALFVLLSALVAAEGAAQRNRNQPAQPQAQQQDTTRRPAGRRFADLVRDATHRPGFFDTYEKGDTLYLVIPKDRVGQDFLVTLEIAQGAGTGGLFGGTMLNIFEGSVVALERHGSRVFLVRKPHRFMAPGGSP